MKKFFIAFAALIILSSFTFKVENNSDFTIKYEMLKVNDMTYMVVYNKYVNASSSSTSTAVSVVNITKDILEVEKTRLEIQYLKIQLNKK